MKKKIIETLFLFSTESALLGEDGGPKSGVKIKQSNVEQATGIIHYLMQRFEISQRNALSLFMLVTDELNWNVKIPSQATLSRRISKTNEELPAIWRNLVIGDNGEIKNCRETPKNNERVQYLHYSITATLTKSHVIFSDGEIKYLRLKNLSNIPQPTNSLGELKKTRSLDAWFTDNQELITPLNSLFQLTPTKLFDSLIPLYPRRALNGGEWLEDIFDEYEKTKNKIELISELIRPERPEKHRVFTTPDGAYNAILIDLYFTNNDSEPELISFIWLRCNRTQLNFIGYFEQFVRLAIYSSFSIQISRHKKAVRMRISAEDKVTQSPLYVSFPHHHNENIKVKGWANFASDLPFRIDVELASKASAIHSVAKITLDNDRPSDRAMVLKHIKQWLIWNNNKAKLNDSDVNFFIGETEQGSVFSYKENEDVLATAIHPTDKETPFMRKIKYADE
ncbi:hypothetical protein NBRC116592_35050 [Colwellia sp. KU-HH00111]|uniref:hypothetical protein n=1 Tax=Colwellia sp. KU-HH00111 TaxID=3127652 RepID=UPI00310726F0